MRRSSSSSSSGLEFDLHPLAGGCFVDEVNRLVGEKSIGDVAVGQRRRGDDRRVGDSDAVMGLVLLLQAAQDGDRVFDRRLRDEHRLEPPRQGRILLDMLAIFVERRCAHAVQVAARQRRLQEIGGVHRPLGLARADQRVHLVDEQDDAAVGRGHFGQHRLETLLELAAIFRSRDQRAHVERHELLVAQRFRHVAVDDAKRETLDDRRLADAGLADEHRIVLGPARQHLDGAADLLVAANHRIELAIARGVGKVAGVFLQRVILVLGARRIRGAALSEVVDRGVEGLGGDACVGQDLGRFGPLLHRQRQKQALHGDKRIARLLGDLLGVVEQPRHRRRHIELASARALDFRQLAERLLDLPQRLARVSAGPVDQARGQTLLVVEQHFKQMLGGKLLMAFAKRQRLGSLHEAARPLGVFLQVHRLSPSALPCAPKRRQAVHTIGLPRFRGLDPM